MTESTDSSGSDPTPNKLTISCTSIDNLVYVEGSAVVTSDKKYTVPPTISQGTDGSWSIIFDCDRKKSSQVADTFNDRCGNTSLHEYTNQAGDDVPGQLNFCFQVTCTFADGAAPMTLNLGQGSNTLGGNNWFIGGSNVVNDSIALLIVVKNNQVFQVYRISGGNDDFNLVLQK